MAKKISLAGKRARAKKPADGMSAFRRALRAAQRETDVRPTAVGGLAPISVVIPSHNYARFLPQLLTSLARQGRKPAEIIVVDNGSSDGTGALLARLWKTSPIPLRMIIQRQSIGRPRARNEGIAAARSELVFLIDADDWAAPDALEKLGAALDENPKAAFAYGFARLEGDRSGMLAYADYNVEELLVHNFIPSCVLLRKSAWAASGGFD
ncbi:MAG: glycosyltransferase family 2 protein, partial [Candidatus Micrarchaeota archaeon]|nr:glycosyltransferase family 2 protein [Candidatus Micrarchaeota archaeon]